MTEETRDAFPSALLDTLLPGGAGFPSASAAGIASAMTSEEERRLLASARFALPSDFLDRGEGGRIMAVEALETRLGKDFDALVVAAYSRYYTSASVLEVITSTTGYRHPPQPFGYDLAVFDDAVVSKARTNPPSWRDPSAHAQKGRES